jgi:hypothetical protein
MDRIRPTILKYYLYQASVSFGFFTPIIAVATLGGICLIGIIVVSLWETPVGAETETVSGPTD